MPLGFNSGAKASEDFHLSDSSMLMTPGKTETITAKNGSLEAIDVIWSSSNEAAATVDGSGRVTAVGWGQSVITANSPAL